MNQLLTAFAALTVSWHLLACAGVTPGQQASETANSAGATSKKAWHRVSEEACTGTQAECDAQKTGNKASEARDDANNKAKEAADRGQ